MQESFARLAAYARLPGSRALAAAAIGAARAVCLSACLVACHGGHGARRDGGESLADGAADDAGSGIDAAPPPDDTMPEGTSAELTLRVKHLLEAIANDDPELATDIEFPRDGWLLTHDAADPGKDWEKHVARPFRNGVHGLSKRHKEVARAELVSIEIGHSAQQTTPKKHGWTKALWTVRESRITFVVDGRTHMLPIREMAAWRGAWYVTRLR
jgi:hypothetical protein